VDGEEAKTRIEAALPGIKVQIMPQVRPGWTNA